MNNLALKNSAYNVENSTVRSEKSIEYQAFADATSAMSRYSENNSDDFSVLAKVTHQNRRLWNVLATDVMSDDNQLPVSVRAGIFSLSQFVMKHSSQVLNGDATLDALIEINRSVMRGLRN